MADITENFNYYCEKFRHNRDGKNYYTFTIPEFMELLRLHRERIIMQFYNDSPQIKTTQEGDRGDRMANCDC